MAAADGARTMAQQPPRWRREGLRPGSKDERMMADDSGDGFRRPLPGAFVVLAAIPGVLLRSTPGYDLGAPAGARLAASDASSKSAPFLR